MITDEMVEVAVDGAVKALWSAPDDAPAQATLIRAALTAVLPMIRAEVLEDAARIAEGWPVEAAGNDYQTNGNGRFWDAGTNYHQSRMDAAAAIRAMKGDNQ